MNEFTKEQLSIIHLAIIRDMTQFSHILKSSSSMIKLRDKLETMIDNYCDHKNQIMDCDGDISMVCQDCGQTTRDI